MGDFFMSNEGFKRKLAAILSADAVGYGRLMAEDEAATVKTVTSYREIMAALINQHRGRVVDSPGDNLLAEFPSVVDAVQCAVAVQNEFQTRNAELTKNRRMEFRIGINLGDVIDDEGRLYGDGVNVAARLEGLAEPGGVCVSAKAYDEVRGKVETQFDDLGPQDMKNLEDPVRAYRLRLDGDSSFAIDVSTPVMGFGGRPAIAVLPFDNMSVDPEQEYFADGIAEDILTRLAMWRWIPVIARNSSFTFKGRTVDVKEIGTVLGARYVLEGSVRKVGERVRVTCQLIDADTGHHIWAERYDRVLKDIFELQDEITEAIVAALEPAVGKAEMLRVQRKDTSYLDSWDLYQRGVWYFSRFTKDDFAAGYGFYRRSAELDPGFARPLAGIATIRILEALLAWSDNPAEALGEAHRLALEAVSFDAAEPLANALLGYSNAYLRQYDAGLAAAKRAIELNPSFAMGYHALGLVRMFNGEPTKAVDAVESAVRISPEDLWLPVWLATLSASYYMTQNYEKAFQVARLSIQRAPHYPIGHRSLANALAQLGRMDEAREALTAFLKLSPKYNAETARRSAIFRREADYEHYAEGLRKAGWDG
jgi:adenylate cyclase